MERALSSDSSSRGPRTGPRLGFRWVTCGLLFFATTINYMDRIVLNILAPDLQAEIGWNEAEYGYINMAFTLAYAVGLLVMGGVMDRLGTRRGFTLSITAWSLAAMGHALARSWQGFAVARFTLALGEAGNFPGAIKTVAEWFPKKERALATGIFNAGSNVGLLITPIVVPAIVHVSGHWQWAFIFTGAVGFVWIFFWTAFYHRPEEHPRLTAAELAYIQQDPPEPLTRIPWVRILPHRQTWAFAIGKFLTDPVWWVVFNFWLAKYLNATYGLTLTGLMAPLVFIYLMADVGSIGGGWLSSRLLKVGWSVNAARKTAMFICGACVVPLFFAPHVVSLNVSRDTQVWITVSLIGLAAAAHQGWSANLFTLVSDTFPRRAVGSVVGFGGMFGGLGGVLASLAAGWSLELTKSSAHPSGNYNPILYVAAFMYFITLAIIHSLTPRLQPVSLEDHSVKP